MKNTFQVIGIITLLFGSFMYTEKVSKTAHLSDELLTEITDKASAYEVKPIEAVINNNTIIPGINGKIVDVKKSYNEMKEIGYFNEKLLKYKIIKVKNPLIKNKDKYIISGNQTKKQVALLFMVDNNDNIDYIVNILEKNKVKGSFYINSLFLEKNYNFVINLMKQGHIIGNLSNNEDYNDNDFVWMKTIVTNHGNQKANYCFVSHENSDVLDICFIQSSYTIKPEIISSRPFISIKNSLSKGKIFALNINDETKEELSNIINYIKGKGYQIVSLEKLLDE